MEQILANGIYLGSQYAMILLASTVAVAEASELPKRRVVIML
jgi:hypothetical protein